ncbi:MAG TPA: hypothetical protein VN922_21525, partial [Bacteroidia bacterium]|nr:hypothetical protein [Bacteroidia bacterium]
MYIILLEGDIQQSALSDSEDPSITDEEEPLLMDSNPDDSHETIFWRRIMTEKRLRQQEIHVIKREREMLEGERRQILEHKTNMEQQQKDLQTREQKLVEHEALIPSIRELQGYDITLEVLQQYITM